MSIIGTGRLILEQSNQAGDEATKLANERARTESNIKIANQRANDEAKGKILGYVSQKASDLAAGSNTVKDMVQSAKDAFSPERSAAAKGISGQTTTSLGGNMNVMPESGAQEAANGISQNVAADSAGNTASQAASEGASQAASQAASEAASQAASQAASEAASQAASSAASSAASEVAGQVSSSAVNAIAAV